MASKRDAKITAIENRIVDIEEASPYLTMLAYGRNGKGKTRFGASAENVLIIDINEDGTRSAKGYKGAKVLHCSKWEDVVYAKWYLRERDHPYDAVAIDNLTQMQMVCMKQVLKEKVERDPNADPKLPRIQDWGKLKELLMKEIYDFKHLPMHTIFLAQERTLTDDDGIIEEVTIDMSTASRGIALGAVDIIGRIYKKKVRVGDKKKGKEVTKWEVRLFVGDHPDLVTKDRTHALGQVVRNPTVPKIIKMIEAYEKEQ